MDKILSPERLAQIQYDANRIEQELLDCIYALMKEQRNLKIDNEIIMNALVKQDKTLRSALQFYAERAVYEKLNQFPGDEEYSPCSSIAEEALK